MFDLGEVALEAEVLERAGQVADIVGGVEPVGVVVTSVHHQVGVQDAAAGLVGVPKFQPLILPRGESEPPPAGLNVERVLVARRVAVVRIRGERVAGAVDVRLGGSKGIPQQTVGRSLPKGTGHRRINESERSHRDVRNYMKAAEGRFAQDLDHAAQTPFVLDVERPFCDCDILDLREIDVKCGWVHTIGACAEDPGSVDQHVEVARLEPAQHNVIGDSALPDLPQAVHLGQGFANVSRRALSDVADLQGLLEARGLRCDRHLFGHSGDLQHDVKGDGGAWDQYQPLMRKLGESWRFRGDVVGP